MATQKPISTISYNTEPFLREKLDGWIQAHIIQAYMYICHKGEDGDKDHIHLRIEPNKKLDPMDLTELLTEYELGKDKPLGCRPWRPSKEEDWYLYVVHDEKYLKLKYGGGEKGEKLPYIWTDIQVSNMYDLEVAWVRAKAYLEHTTVNMATKLQQGDTALSLVMQGENPYMVNAIVKTLYSTDYERVAHELEQMTTRVCKLEQAISDAGCKIHQDDETGQIILVLPTWEDLTD